MKRVLMVSCEGLGNGGVQAVIMSIVRSLKDKYIFDILLFTNEQRFYDKEFESYGGKIFRIPRYEGENHFRKKIDYYIRGNYIYKNVLRILEKNTYDVVHCHDEYESALILKAAARKGVKTRIIHTHVITGKRNILAYLLESYRKRIIEDYATVKIACSKEAAVSFYNNQENVKIINNTFDDKKFSFSKYKNRKNKLQLIQIGRFEDIKNQLFSIKIIDYIKNKYNNGKLILIGEQRNMYTEILRKEIINRNLTDSILILPSNADSPKLLSESTAFLLPSLHEGFGIVLIEAQAMGIRCYASNRVPEITNCGGVTYLSLDDGIEKWAETIIADYKLYNGIRERFDISKFTMGNIIKKYDDLYKGE